MNTGQDDALEQLKKVPGIKEVTLETAPPIGTAAPAAGARPTADGYRGFLLRVEAGADPRAEIYRLAVDRKWTLRELARRRATLEDVFVEITHAE